MRRRRRARVRELVYAAGALVAVVVLSIVGLSSMVEVIRTATFVWHALRLVTEAL